MAGLTVLKALIPCPAVTLSVAFRSFQFPALCNTTGTDAESKYWSPSVSSIIWTMQVGNFSMISENGNMFPIKIEPSDSLGEIMAVTTDVQQFTTAKVSTIFQDMLAATVRSLHWILCKTHDITKGTNVMKMSCITRQRVYSVTVSTILV